MVWWMSRFSGCVNGVCDGEEVEYRGGVEGRWAGGRHDLLLPSDCAWRIRIIIRGLPILMSSVNILGGARL